MTRVLVTGIGSLSSLADDVSSFWNRLCAGESGIRRLSRIDVSSLPCQIGGEIAGRPPLRSELVTRATKHLDRASLYALHAADQAVADAGLPCRELGDRCGIVLGAGLSGLDTLQEQTNRLLTLGPRRVSPFTIPTLMPNAAPAAISLAFGVTGPSYTVSSACASSGHAIIDALELIRRGACDCVITGGTESSLTELGMAAFCRMNALATGCNDRPEAAVRPFDAGRNGFVMSEGAAILVLESEAHATQRQAQVYAEISGYGMSSDAYDVVKPAPSAEQAARAMRQALQSAGLGPGEVADHTYVNAHGTGTIFNDRTETVAIKRAFGNEAKQLQISSTKSMTGHLIGAACSTESVACVLALRHGTIPPTINLETPDPECDLDYVPCTARPAPIDYALNNSFGFGGHNVSILFSRY